MRLIEIKTQVNGAHNNQVISGEIIVQDGWAVIPDDMECENFPFGEVVTEEINGVMTLTMWTPGMIPDDEDMEYNPTQLDIIEAQLMYVAMMTDNLLEV